MLADELYVYLNHLSQKDVRNSLKFVLRMRSYNDLSIKSDVLQHWL